MSHFKLISYEDAPTDVRTIYDETMTEMGIPFVLNWFKCQGANAILLRGNWEKLRSTMLRGHIPLLLKQLIIYNISYRKGCTYCTRAHGVMANSMGQTLMQDPGKKIIDHLDSDLIPSTYRTAITVVSKCALTPDATTAEDFEALKQIGFNNVEIQELMSLADLTNMLNTIADISGITIDNELMEPQS